MKSFNDFFEKVAPCKDGELTPLDREVQASFDRVSHSIVTSIDSEGFCQLCVLIPHLYRLFPLLAATSQIGSDTLNEPGKVGFGKNRLHYLFHVLVNALLCGGRPVLIVLDDLQWADALAVELMGNFITTVDGTSILSKELCQKGLLLLGSFRDDEVEENGFLMEQIKVLQKAKGYVNVTFISTNELLMQDINKMLSYKLCLPMRVTRQLAELVHRKTSGNPLYVKEFLKSIIQSKLLEFSVKSRRWIWDEESIDMQIISESVAELMTKKLRKLPKDIIEALKIASCFGSQVNETTIKVLISAQVMLNMIEALDLAIKKGLMERRGPIYARVYIFSHDLLQETIYNLIPIEERLLLHKKIGLSLIKHSEADGSTVYLLAADQINICKDYVLLNPDECSLFAGINLAAGKQSLASSSFEQALSYFKAGISLLGENHWQNQYSLSLELHEMYVLVRCMYGNIADTELAYLDNILFNAKSFEDTLKASALLAKVLISNGKYGEATTNCLDILSKLGESFPEEIHMPDVMIELKETQSLLKGITIEKVMHFPLMMDATKLNAMKFLSLLCDCAIMSEPALLPLLSCRMVKLSLQFGLSNDSIVGLVVIGGKLIHMLDDIELASQIGTIAESLIEANPSQLVMRAKLTALLYGTVKVFVNPFQSLSEKFLNGYKSAMLVGNVEHAAFCGFLYCINLFYIGDELEAVKHFMANFLQQMVRSLPVIKNKKNFYTLSHTSFLCLDHKDKHKQYMFLNCTMSYFNTCTALAGDDQNVNNIIKIKSNEELAQMGTRGQNSFLMHKVILNQICTHFWFREYIPCVTLAEKYRLLKAKRTLDFFNTFYEGIASLCLARDTKQDKWRKIGEKAVETMSQLMQHSSWNFENKLFLLSAELHYLNNDLGLAEIAYENSIATAQRHKFIHEEALAYELYGIFCIENRDVSKGMEQLNLSLQKYIQWGASKKVDAMKYFMHLVDPVHLLKHNFIK